MDLKLLDAAATEFERHAVDGVLGPPESGWEGGERDVLTEGQIARGGHARRSRRHLLLPALQALQEHAGWISPGGMNYDRTKPDRCYLDGAAAERDGLRAAKL